MPNDLIEAQRDAMLATFRQAGISRATYLAEVAQVARAAAAEGDFGPAARLYELVGKGMGILSAERHLHLHGAGGSGVGEGGGVAGGVSVRNLAGLTDAQLLELAQDHMATQADVVAVRADPVPVAGGAVVAAEVDPGEDPLFR